MKDKSRVKNGQKVGGRDKGWEGEMKDGGETRMGGRDEGWEREKGWEGEMKEEETKDGRER